jgi:hypothetical protein
MSSPGRNAVQRYKQRQEGGKRERFLIQLKLQRQFNVKRRFCILYEIGGDLLSSEVVDKEA